MRHSRTLALVVSLVGLVAANAVAGVNAWTLHGPQGGGGATFGLAVHPTNGSIALTATSSGIFRSANGGASWTLVKNDTMNVVSQIAFDPSAPNRVFASDGQLYLSEDAGLTFAVAQGPVAFNQVTRIAFGPGSTLYATTNIGRLFRSVAPFSTWTEITTVPWFGNTNPYPYPQMLTVDPGNAQILYVGIESYGLFRSADGGLNWSRLDTNGIVTPTTFSHLAFAPGNSTRLVLATGGGLYLSTNSGSTWSRNDTQPAFWVGFDPGTPGALAATRTYDIARSTNGGDSWIDGVNLRANHMPAASFAPGSPGRLLISGHNGIAISTDGGATGNYSLTGLTGVMPREVVASNDGTGTVLAAMPSGRADIFRRNGAAYAPLDPQALEAVLNFNRTIGAIAVAPSDSGQIFVVNQGSQLIRTFNGGASWTAPHSAFTANPADYIIDLQIDPNNSQIAYVGRTITGLWGTTNGGVTFARLGTPPDYLNAPVYVTGIGVSPHDGTTLFVGGGANSNGNGIWKSTNGGVSWTEQLPTTGGNPIMSFAFHPTDPNTIYGSGWSGVWRTTNGGGTWTPIVFQQVGGSTSPIASAVLIDPLFPSTLTVVGTVNGPGLLRSVDSGATWESVPMNLPATPTQFFSGVLDPINPSTVIAATTSRDIAEYQVSPNLELTATALPLPVPVSSNVSITYTVTNRGPHASSASQLDVNFPAWLTPSVPANCARTGTLLRCQLGALRVDQSVSVPLTLAVGATPADAQINSSLTGHEPDVAMANNSVTTNVSSAEIADVDVVFTGGAPAIDRTQSTNVTATVSNAGPSPSTATVLILQIPSILTISNIVANGTCTPSTDTITCNLGTILSGASTNVTFTATGSVVGNSIVAATVQRAGIDPDNSHGATRDFTVRAIADLGIALADSADPVTAGNAFQYTATISNAGPDAGAVSSTITVAGATVTSATVSGGTCTNTAAAAVCNFTSLASGASAAITVNVSAGAAGTASATGTVQFGGTDSVGANNSSTANTTVSAPPPPNNGGGGGGGGGRFDWLLAAALALMASRRVRLGLARAS